MGSNTALADIRLLALDVDGVLTDGRLWYSETAGEIKAFHVHDGSGLKRVMAAGVTVVLISARSSSTVSRRAAELGIDRVHQGIEDKDRCLVEAANTAGVQPVHCAFMGDDEADLAAFAVAGLCIAPANAVPAVRVRADWCTEARGGEGAVREVCDRLMAARPQADDA